MSIINILKEFAIGTTQQITAEWTTIFFVDAITSEKRGVMMREVVLENDMSSNDLCFCGSGKKHKKCHSDINPNSAMANLLYAYHKIEEERKSIQNTVCTKGCSECCSDYFQISAVEFFTILRHLKIYSSDDIEEIIALATKNTANMPMLSNDFYNIKNFSPCIFLDDRHGECKIYEVRPIMCRIYGNYNGITRCDKVLSNSQATQSLLDAHGKTELQNNIDVFELNGQHAKVKGKPIAYWFSSLQEKQTQRFRDLQVLAQSRPINEFVKVLFI